MGIRQYLLHKIMGKLVPVQQVVQAQNGEVTVTINLNLTIKVDDDGKVSLSSAEARPLPVVLPTPPKEENPKFEMPDLDDNIGELLPDFGK